MQSYELKYYEWNDIKETLCEYMDIDPKYFRDYHKLVGGDYKDFWHVWLSLVNDDVQNDSYKVHYRDMITEEESYIIEKYGDWISVFISAIKRLLDEIQEGDEDSFIVHYWW